MKRTRKNFLIIFLIFCVILVTQRAFCFIVSWTANTEQVDGYRIYYSPDLQEVLGKTASFVQVIGKTSTCIQPDFNEYSIKGYFVGATAYNDAGESDLSNIVYVLFGNIYGNDWDGITASEARVDGQDLNILGFYFGQTVTHQQIDCAVNFVLENPDLKQRADLNGDGRIDGYDLMELAVRFGNTMP